MNIVPIVKHLVLNLLGVRIKKKNGTTIIFVLNKHSQLLYLLLMLMVEY